MKRILLVLIFSSTSLWAKFSIGGSYQNQSTLGAGSEPTQFINSSELAIDLNYKDEGWRFYSDLRLGLFYGVGDLIDFQPNNFLYVKDFNGNSQLGLALDIPRMYVKINSIMGTFTIGRSYLNFGHASLFNPLEWFKNFSPTDPLATKPGVNLISLDIPMGAYNKVKIFIGGDDQWDTPLAGAEAIIGTSGFEMGITYQYKGHNQNVVGTFFKADIYITLFGSYVAHINDVFSEDIFNHAHEFSLGLDYSFPIGLTSLFIQHLFYFNSLGAKTESELLIMPLGDHYFRGQTYSYTSLQLTIDQFSILAVDMIINIHDASGVILPKGSFTLLNNLTLDLVMGIYWGKKGTEFTPSQAGVPNVQLLATLTAQF